MAIEVRYTNKPGPERRHDYSDKVDGDIVDIINPVNEWNDYRVRAARRDARANGLKIRTRLVALIDTDIEPGMPGRSTRAVRVWFYLPGGPNDPSVSDLL